MARRTYEFRNAVLDWVNLAGAAVGTNQLGARNCKVVLEHEDAEKMEDEGFIITWKNAETAKEAKGMAKLHLSYQFEPKPNVWMVTVDGDGNPVSQMYLDETRVHMIDSAHIVSANIDCSVSVIKKKGAYEGRLSLYITDMYVHVRPSGVSAMYANVPIVGMDIDNTTPDDMEVLEEEEPFR